MYWPKKYLFIAFNARQRNKFEDIFPTFYRFPSSEVLEWRDIYGDEYNNPHLYDPVTESRFTVGLAQVVSGPRFCNEALVVHASGSENPLPSSDSSQQKSRQDMSDSRSPSPRRSSSLPAGQVPSWTRGFMDRETFKEARFNDLKSHWGDTNNGTSGRSVVHLQCLLLEYKYNSWCYRGNWFQPTSKR